MKLFKRGDNSYAEYVDFDYKVGDPIEVLEGGKWELYIVQQAQNGSIYLQPYAGHFSLQWIWDIHAHHYRQTLQTFQKAISVCEAAIAEKQAIIDHRREKNEIEEWKATRNRFSATLATLSTESSKGKDE